MNTPRNPWALHQIHEQKSTMNSSWIAKLPQKYCSCISWSLPVGPWIHHSGIWWISQFSRLDWTWMLGPVPWYCIARRNPLVPLPTTNMNLIFELKGPRFPIHLPPPAFIHHSEETEGSEFRWECGSPSFRDTQPFASPAINYNIFQIATFIPKLFKISFLKQFQDRFLWHLGTVDACYFEWWECEPPFVKYQGIAGSKAKVPCAY